MLHIIDVEDNETIKKCLGLELRDLPKYYYIENKPRCSTRRSNNNPWGTQTKKMPDCTLNLDIMSTQNIHLDTPTVQYEFTLYNFGRMRPVIKVLVGSEQPEGE